MGRPGRECKASRKHFLFRSKEPLIIIKPATITLKVSSNFYLQMSRKFILKLRKLHSCSSVTLYSPAFHATLIFLCVVLQDTEIEDFFPFFDSK